MKNKKPTGSDKHMVDLKDSLNFIFKLKEQEIFDNEYKKLEEELQSDIYKKIKPFIVSNFISTKLSNLNEQYATTKQFLRKYNNPDFNLKDYIDLDEYKSTSDYMAQELNVNLEKCKNSINEDYKKIVLLQSKANLKDPLISSENFKYLDLDKKSKIHSNEGIINTENNGEINQNNNNNLYNNVDCLYNDSFKSRDYQGYNKNLNSCVSSPLQIQLKITYFDGCDTNPQFLNISTEEFSNMDNFLYIFKKRLGIYEYAKFKVIILENNKGIMLIM